ncbi:MAG: aminopeptidase P N-terminal domain-containing protein [Verrucomicrobiales bacterium]|nr:aminopeptidase P N-terminal domain-containing protein [Verrucomicrobiales bacterium]
MNENRHRLRRLQLYDHFREGEAMILFAGSAPRKTADAHYPFFANRNFYYLTGILQADSIFLAVNVGGSVEETLFVHKKDRMAERWHGYRLSREEVSELSGVEQVEDLDLFDSTLKGFLDQGAVSTLSYDFDKFDAGRSDAPHNDHSKRIRVSYPFLTLKNIYPTVCSARTIKDREEISHIREAMCITRDGIHAMMKTAKADLYEYQLEAVFNKVLSDAGVREPAFTSIVSGGQNNFYIHYEEPIGILKEGDLILTDVGARKNEYVTDISRAFPVNGKFTTEQKEVYEIALKVNKELMGLLVPGLVSFADIEKHSRRRVGEELVAAGYLGKEEDVSKYYWHKGTHHIGLDVHDVGPPAKVIEPGMVFTIDVGIYIEEKNIGFRVEDDVAITGSGYEHLSSEIVREIDDIEAMMS